MALNEVNSANIKTLENIQSVCLYSYLKFELTTFVDY